MFGLTRQEKMVVLFLLGSALAGLGADFLFKRFTYLRELPEITFQKQKVNLNNATIDELISLPGIGPKTAQRIIEYRDNRGGFREIEDLRQIKGMRNETLEKIEGSVVIE
ncbi:MAG: helix-hairpin-helix domain-containing protein [Candidatus Omnitrophica bacterium]|nr:helix-hairpin-helix domain-containing protein [Candidatus Omnitrophota bacterium]